MRFEPKNGHLHERSALFFGVTSAGGLKAESRSGRDCVSPGNMAVGWGD